jgi:TolB-like protein/DNA-binding winged helix-turn-helix (wHTH) protein
MGHRYRFDDIEVDLRSFRLMKAGRPVGVEPKALNLLIFLVENRGRLVSRRELIDAVWNGAFVTDHVLNRAIGQLRRQLADDAKEPRYVETVPTLGYRFIAHVDEETAEVETVPAGPDGVSKLTPQSDFPPRPGGLSVSSAQLAPTASALLQEQPQVEELGPAPPGPVHTRLERRMAIAVGMALLLILCVVTYGIVRWRHHSSGPRIQSLAVLPLENLSGDASQQYLADGMTDQLITSLGQISALRVISQTTAMQYRNPRKPLPQIAEELNVDAVVEGSVVRSGDRIRITSQLFDAPTDKQLWAQSYEGDLAGVLGLQNQVATAVAEQTRIALTANERTQLMSKPAVNPAAYEAFLKGNYFDKNTVETEPKALQYYQQATKLDPKFARAYVGVARSYNVIGDWQGIPLGEANAAADAAVAKALELDPGLGEAYAERAWTLMKFRWDFPDAERDFRRGLESDSVTSSIPLGYGEYLVAMGRFDEGLRQMKRARDLDPLSVEMRADSCRMLGFARRDGDAIAQCNAALELDPHSRWTHYLLAEIYERERRYPEAHKIMETFESPRAPQRAFVGNCDAACMAMQDEIHGVPGVEGAFDAWLKMQKEQPTAFFLAYANAGLGRKDQAFAWLEKAYQTRSRQHEMIFLAVDPRFDRLRSDPRFDVFLRHAGLPPQPHIGSAQPGRPSED